MTDQTCMTFSSKDLSIHIDVAIQKKMFISGPSL